MRKWLLEDVKLAIKYVTLTSQRNFISTCLTKKICPRDIQNKAANLRTRNNKPDKVIEKNILKMRLKTANQEVTKTIKQWNKTTKQIETSQIDLPIKQTHRIIKSTEMDRIRHIEKKKKFNKVRWLLNEQQHRTKQVPNTYMDVILTDAALRELYGDQQINHQVYANIPVTKPMIELLKLPSGFRIYNSVDKHNMEVQTEITASTQRWSSTEHEQEPDESLEQRQTRLDNERDQTKIHTTNSIDFSRVRPTSLKHNKVLYLPTASNQRTETKIQDQKNETMDTVNKYISKQIETPTNLTREEAQGRKEILKGIKESGWMLYTTDKSGKLVLDTKDNFLKSMLPHYQGEPTVTIEEIDKAGEHLNNVSRALTRILNIGENIDKAKRCSDTLIVKQPTIPALEGMRKDHKTNYNMTEGPPLRPLLAANQAPNAPLSNILSIFLKGIGNELAQGTMTEAINSEEVCRNSADTNDQVQQNPNISTTQHQQTTQRVLASMDVVGLYPNITKLMAKQAVQQAISQSTLEMKSIDKEILVKYIALTSTRQEIHDVNLQNQVPVPNSRTSLNSWMKSPKTTQFSTYQPIENDQQLKSAMALALGDMVQQAMNNHYFKIGDNIYRQSDGSAIGSDLSGEVARIYMLLWDLMFKDKLQSLDLSRDLYVRYVDDILMSMIRISRGLKYDPSTNTLINDPDVNNNPVHEDQYTFNIIKDVANSIHPNIQMEVDTPSNHMDGKLPVLDLKMWLEDDNSISHTFYSKPVSSPYTILNRSAVSSSCKRSTIFQETIRRMKNVSPNQPWSVKVEILNKWMNTLRISGYNQAYRHNILKGAISRHLEMERMAESGVIARYRNKKEIIANKSMKKGRFNNTWFLGGKGNFASTIKVPQTPSSQLARDVSRNIQGHNIAGGRTKIIETAGKPNSSGMKKKDPFRKPGCPYRNNCSAENNTNCLQMNVTYQLDCQECNINPEGGSRSIYIGCTGKSLHNRTMEHLMKIRGGKQTNAMAKHMMTNHPELQPGERKITAKILKTSSTTMERFVDEALRLESGTNLANSKSEWGCGGLVRLEATRTQHPTGSQQSQSGDRQLGTTDIRG